MSRKGDHDRRLFDTIGPGGHYTGRMFSVAVVGLSGTEKEKGCLGVGKSCLCNRFVRPQADEYNREHISILSQPDFSGPIVNNEHWLYWGETRKCTEEGFELVFSVVEQTEFVDDACFQPFRSGKTMEPYYKRCAATRLSSAEKLMYICKNQLGIEKEYEQHYLPDGRFNVDGFVCVFDVSECQDRSIERQIEMTSMILGSLLKTKKPVVLVTTKNDEGYEPYVREAEKLVARREFKGLIPLVETSAHDNVNVDLAFWACVQRDWTKGKSKLLSYYEAMQRQKDRLEIVNDAYLTLIRSHITDYRTHWNHTYSNLSQSQDFITYCDLFGQESAQQTFKRHVKKLKEEYLCRKIDLYLRQLPKIFSQMLPDLESFGTDQQSWLAVQQVLQEHPLFHSNFVINEGLSWQEMDDTGEHRIPFDLLATPEAEKCFVDHLNSLVAEDHLRSLRYQFSELLRETSIIPGQPLKEIREVLKGRDCVDSLPESEQKLIYDEYQKMLQQLARDQLIELFLERAPLFLQYSDGKMMTETDLNEIGDELSKDERWTAFDLLPQDRRLALIRHLGFLQWPIKEHCPAGQACVELQTEAYYTTLAKRSVRNPLWNSEPDKIHIKLVVLGSSAYADNLATVVKAMCPSLEQENPRIQYEVQVIPGSESMGVLPPPPFLNPLEPEAYLCVYSSRTSLDYVLKTLEQSLLTDLQYGSLHHPIAPAGLPLVLLLASTPDTAGKERAFLREEGANRAQSLQCAFFDLTSNEPHARFKSDELLRALLFVTECQVRRSELQHHVYPSTLPATNIPEGALNPEIRILISLMCGDPISPARFLETLLLPNSLPNTQFYPVSEHSLVTDVGFLVAINEETDEEQLDISQIPSCYVEFVVSSYHSSYAFKEELLYGHILVYWSKREASFSNMSALASSMGSVMPLQILALVENELRPSKLSHQLVAKGQELADNLHAYFRVSTLSSDIGRCISAFLNFSLQNKHHIEKSLQISSAAAVHQNGPALHSMSQHSPRTPDECYDPNMDENFGAMLPPTNHHHPLNHQEQMTEGIYERLPGEDQSKSLQSEGIKESLNEFPSLVRVRRQAKHVPPGRFSPSDMLDAPHNGPEEEAFFYEGNNTNEEQLVKPSQLKQRRRLNNMNYYLQSYPSADSLDRVYSLESPYASGLAQSGSGYYHSQMPPHYVYRPYAAHHGYPSGHSHHPGHPQHRPFFESAFDESAFESLPPRPASSAHVMIPSHAPQPPPYSRIAISPPPAYKMQSHYDLEGPPPPRPHPDYSGLSQISPGSLKLHRHDFPERPLLGHEFDQPPSLAYYQRKFYHHGGPIGGDQASTSYRSLSPPFDPYASVDHYDGMMRHSDLVPSLGPYRSSALMYATTGRGHHTRSSHFHQLGYSRATGLQSSSLFGQPHSPPQGQHSSQLDVSPYAVGRSSYAMRHKKKKKKHGKSRSSSLSHRSSLPGDEEEDEEYEEEDEPTAKELDELTKAKKSLSRLRKKRNEERLARRVRQEKSKSGGEECAEAGDRRSRASAPAEINSDSDESRRAPPPATERAQLESDSESVVGEDDDEDLLQEETASSRLSVEEPVNATADSYALSSGWAYHQNNKQSSPTTTPHQLPARHQFADQWPPTQPTDDENSLAERSKAPGKLDLKRYNNLSNAIGRLTLNSPLGPTRAPHSTFDDILNKTPGPELSPEQISLTSNTIAQPGRRGRLKATKQHSASKDIDSDSENSDLREVTNIESNLSGVNRFSSLKSGGVLAPKRSSLQKKRRVVPVPVAPPRLPSANSSTAVTPTSSGASKLFLSGGSFDDSQADRLMTTSDASDLTSSALEHFAHDESRSSFDFDLRARPRLVPKLLSLPVESESGVYLDENSSIGISAGLDHTAKDNGDDESIAADKAKFLKSKSVTTFTELDKKSMRKAEKAEKKRLKEEERRNRKSSKETSRTRSRSKGGGGRGSHSPLEDFAQANGNPVPLFIEKCTQYVELEGIDMEGIYRVPGNMNHVNTLMQKFDENPDLNIVELDISVNAVTTALKEFFQKRIPPIFPPDTMVEIATLSQQYNDTGRLCEVKAFLGRLPNANLHIIHHMVEHFAKIAEKSKINSMDSKNLAICWWPTLLQFEFSDMLVFEQRRPYLMNFIQILIDSRHELFGGGKVDNRPTSPAGQSSEDNLGNLSLSADELSSL